MLYQGTPCSSGTSGWETFGKYTSLILICWDESVIFIMRLSFWSSWKSCHQYPASHGFVSLPFLLWTLYDLIPTYFFLTKEWMHLYWSMASSTRMVHACCLTSKFLKMQDPCNGLSHFEMHRYRSPSFKIDELLILRFEAILICCLWSNFTSSLMENPVGSTSPLSTFWNWHRSSNTILSWTQTPPCASGWYQYWVTLGETTLLSLCVSPRWKRRGSFRSLSLRNLIFPTYYLLR